jgi:hypothetical protein
MIARLAASGAEKATPVLPGLGDTMRDLAIQSLRKLISRRRLHLTEVLTNVVVRHPMSRIDEFLPFAYVKPKVLDCAMA